jgi:hypothetical protein
VNPVRRPDDTDTNPLEDEFFRQLAEGSLAETDPPRPRRPRPQPPRAPRGGTDPHGPHLIGAPEAGDAHCSGGARSQAAPEELPPRARRRWGRLAAGSSLAIAVLAVALVVLGSDDEQSGPAAASRGAPNGSPASGEPELRVGWGAEGADKLRARWRPGARATVAGRLTTPAGRPVAGARVTVLAADADRPKEGNRTVGELHTNGRGRFRGAIALDRGAARKLLSFSYLAYGDDTVPAAVARVRLEVEAPIRLHARQWRVRRGGRVEFNGDSAPHARVRLVADPPGASGWQPLAKVRAGVDGRWLAEVRFPTDALSGRYRLRARVAANPRLGYLAAASRPLEVEVR